MSETKFYANSYRTYEVTKIEEPENPMETGEYFGHLLVSKNEAEFRERKKDLISRLIPEEDRILATEKFFKDNCRFSSKGDFVYIRNKKDGKLFDYHFMPEEIRKARSVPNPASYIRGKTAELFYMTGADLVDKGYVRLDRYAFFSKEESIGGKMTAAYVTAGEADFLSRNYGFDFTNDEKMLKAYSEYLAGDTLKAYRAFAKGEVYELKSRATEYEEEDLSVVYGKESLIERLNGAKEIPSLEAFKERSSLEEKIGEAENLQKETKQESSKQPEALIPA